MKLSGSDHWQNSGSRYKTLVGSIICPGCLGPNYTVTYYIDWVKTSWPCITLVLVRLREPWAPNSMAAVCRVPSNFAKIVIYPFMVFIVEKAQKVYKCIHFLNIKVFITWGSKIKLKKVNSPFKRIRK